MILIAESGRGVVKLHDHLGNAGLHRGKYDLAMLGSQDLSFPIRTMTEVERLIDGIRASGLGRAEGILFPAQRAVAAPVFDHQDRIVAVNSMG